MKIDNLLIVVPCLNEALHIEGVVRQLFGNELPSRHLVVVAEGGSTDGTQAILGRLTTEFKNLRMMSNPLRLQSAGINLAVETFGADFDYLLRVDAHATYPANYVKMLVEQMARCRAQSVVVPLTSEGKDFFQKSVAFAQNSVLGTGGSAHRHEGKSCWIDHGHHALFDLAWFKKVGGYNPTLSHNEDAEYDVRLLRAGGKIWLAGNVPVIYYPRNSLTKLCKQYFTYGGGRARTVSMHKTPLKIRQMIPISIGPMCLAAIVGLVFWWLAFPLALPTIAWASAAIGFGVYLAVKYKAPEALLAGPAAMAMHVSWSLGYWRQVSRRRDANANAFASDLSGYARLQKSMLIGRPVKDRRVLAASWERVNRPLAVIEESELSEV